MLDKAPNKRVADFLAAFGKALSSGDGAILVSVQKSEEDKT